MLLLTIGVVAVALALVLVLAAASQVHLARQRLYDAADALAVGAADELDTGSYYDRLGAGGSPEVMLTDTGVADAVGDQVREHPEALRGLTDVRVVDASTPDGRTAHVALSTRVRPGALTWLTAGLADGITVTAQSSARAD
ncbi:hypothetical protein [Luteimicrobium subarcticum]|uniref:Flp pilus-assembly TadE/G-like protein n=1 Tax=Luteimicrobium subarcticum TaxID=620910 RepID=A0A2M8WUB9_9MICO|nr:hypothetical protein [Luteimicrobium subarcticum]PJI94545.1 hypothetical protein CLV34_0389 [Luteimicrobium subarcticum]